MQIKEVAVDKLIPYAKNSRTHSPEQVAQIAASIKEFGFRNPILVDGVGIIAGHGRLMAAQKLNLSKVPTIDCSDMSESQKKAYIIADNKLALNAGWDMDFLKLELQELEDADFDLSLTGFDDKELDALLNVIEGTDGLTDEDAVPETPIEPKTKLGDIYILGNHRLMCGDSTSLDQIEKLLEGEMADMAFTDPPYNVDYGNSNNPKHKSRQIMNDKMNDDDWNTFVNDYITALLTYCHGNIYIAMSDKELGHMQLTFEKLGGKWASFIVWVKDRLVLSGKDYHSRHETILYGWKDGVSDRQRVEDRTETDVWEIKRPSNSELHPTMKPVELVERALTNSSKSGNIVLDLFGGSGTTMIAAERLGRKARLMELDPKYCDVIVKRWEDFTGKKAVLSEL
jgi:DNA modification methylase